MLRSYSPLRYPGGKSSLFGLLSEFIQINKLRGRRYAEPYAGGCGLALALLMNGCVSDIHINDIDRGIWAFWDAVLNNTRELIEKIRAVDISIEERYVQKEKLKNAMALSDFDCGFATFFLNRTNRSGIINAGAIGGKNQDGKYTIDCRFNKEALIRRIVRIAAYKARIHLTNKDASTFMRESQHTLSKESLFCIDPPYFYTGASLYTNYYKKSDHEKIAQEIINLKQPWIVTYDNAKEIRRLYKSHRQFTFSLQYSATIKRKARELMIVSEGLDVPKTLQNGSRILRGQKKRETV